MKILYEDHQLIVCVKKVGVLSEQNDNEENMISLLSQGNRYIGSVHRLDRNVGGVMVFSKEKAVTAQLSAQILDKTLQKEYIAVISGKPENTKGILEDLLFKDARKNKTFVVKRKRNGVKEASLSYELLGSLDTEKGVISLLKIRLHTGRTHQIRVQFASRKMPLLGDGKYGSRDNGCLIALWSFHLQFENPESGRVIASSFPPPLEQYPWSCFKTTIEAIL